MINVGRLSMALSPTNVACTSCTWAGDSAPRDPIIEGGGGARNVKAPVVVFKILWRVFFNS